MEKISIVEYMIKSKLGELCADDVKYNDFPMRDLSDTMNFLVDYRRNNKLNFIPRCEWQINQLKKDYHVERYDYFFDQYNHSRLYWIAFFELIIEHEKNNDSIINIIPDNISTIHKIICKKLQINDGIVTEPISFVDYKPSQIAWLLMEAKEDLYSHNRTDIIHLINCLVDDGKIILGNSKPETITRYIRNVARAKQTNISNEKIAKLKTIIEDYF